MKMNNIKLLIASLALLVMAGCTQTSELSKPTFWPVIEINGPEYMVLDLGDSYTEQGATVTENGSPIPYTTTGAVNDAEPGVYYVTYSGTNVDGISASKTRIVVVADPAAAADNLNGSFNRTGQAGQVSTWTKDPSKAYAYVVNNVGGVPPSNASYVYFNANFYAYNVAPGIVVVPEQQVSILAPFYCTVSLGGSRLIPFNVNANPGDIGYAWVVNGANFGTVLRTFRKL